MKLIIDIDEQHFELLQMAVMNGMGDNEKKIIAQGIPLEQIRAEIADLDDADYDYEGYYKAVTDAVKIIDKYMGDKE